MRLRPAGRALQPDVPLKLCSLEFVCSWPRHFVLAPNAWLQETFEDYNESWERKLVTNFPALRDGDFELPEGPGLGLDLDLDEVMRHPYHENPDISLFEEDWQLRRSKPATR